jgi:CubicO group peptidase (beta-lactamase class C family)
MNEKNIEKMIDFIEEYVPEAMREGKVPGFSIAVVQEGETIYAHGFGARDPAKSLPATPDTLYGIGSCTKSFVCIAIMQLVEQGILMLTDPVSKYIPLKIGIPGAPITLHHLLSHSSGIPSLATSTVALHRGIGLDTGVPWGSANDFYRLVNGAQDEIASPPGTRFFYNNAAFRMLGHVIQEASGVPFHEYVTENILCPLGLKRTTLVKGEYIQDPNTITPHWKKPDGTVEPTDFPYPDIAENPDFSFIAAAGGIFSSVVELTRYLRLNLEGGTIDDTRILSPESLNTMHTFHTARAPTAYGRYGYGYGWSITPDFLGHKLVHHGGSILVSTAGLALLPYIDAGVALAANSSAMPHPTIAEGVLVALLGKDPWETVPALRIRRLTETLTGTYKAYKGLAQVRVVKKAGLLHLEQKTPFAEAVTPLIPDGDPTETYSYYTLTDATRQPVDFVFNSPSDLDLYIERYRYHKKF